MRGREVAYQIVAGCGFVQGHELAHAARINRPFQPAIRTKIIVAAAYSGHQDDLLPDGGYGAEGRDYDGHVVIGARRAGGSDGDRLCRRRYWRCSYWNHAWWTCGWGRRRDREYEKVFAGRVDMWQSIFRAAADGEHETCRHEASYRAAHP
jgi:hypothetical protein